MLKIMLKNFFDIMMKLCACAIQVCSIRDDSKQSCRILSCCSLNEAFDKENTRSEAAEDG